MDAYICNRCKKVVIDGTDRRIRINREIFGADGRLVSSHDLDLCPACNEEFEEFLHNCDLGEVTQNIPNTVNAELDPATKNLTSQVTNQDSRKSFSITNQHKDDNFMPQMKNLLGIIDNNNQIGSLKQIKFLKKNEKEN